MVCSGIVVEDMTDTPPPYEPTLIHLPGTKLTPEVVLHRTLNKLEHIKSVALIICWNDDTFDTDWSQQQLNVLCAGALVLQRQAVDALMGEDPDGIIFKPRGPA